LILRREQTDHYSVGGINVLLAFIYFVNLVQEFFYIDENIRNGEKLRDLVFIAHCGEPTMVQSQYDNTLNMLMKKTCFYLHV